MDPHHLGLGRNGKFGISCTGAALIHDWVAAHPAPKLILHRPDDQIDKSLGMRGMLPAAVDFRLDDVDGMHIEWRELFVAGVARKAWKHLKLPGDFNQYRHAEMVTWYVEPKHDTVAIKTDAIRDYMNRVKAAL